ncbi:MAG: insulinase family protein [Flavobacteriales bacterium]|nr:insulinase family protein [Flavobacteriales bacterium]
MKNLHKILLALPVLFLAACSQDGDNSSSNSKYAYETVEGDPLNAMIYTLDNGLKVYMSVNKDEPRVVTQIAVRTGSKQDPADATGLAHYLEHMLFKGTSGYGTKDWENEKVLIQQVSDLYEEHRNTSDADERKAIYLQIDSISGEAAKLAIANEYDKMIGSLGAQGTNAYTWYEQTVYINDVPANELEKWAKLESERFKELVLRLFHTELEAVYEEFNRTLDSDYRQAYYMMMAEMFKEHQYGTQTTIGTSEHLKNPSMEKIHAYFKERYVPNNMAIVLSGDIDPDETVEMIEKYFGDYERGELSEFVVAEEAPITEPIVKDITGVQAEFVNIGYRLPGAGTPEATTLLVMDGILSNGQAGLIDLNLVQKQKVLRAYSSPTVLKDYSMLMLSGNPRGDQDLNDVAELLRGQIELIKSGEFEDWMVEAVVNDMKLSELRQSESNWSRAGKMVDSFIYEEEWGDVVGQYDEMAKLTKQDIVDFANKWFGDNYVQVNKRIGENNAVKVEKPQITPVEIDREAQSEFYLSWDSVQSGRIDPVFVDYKSAITSDAFDNGVDFYNIQNENNDLFSLYYILDMGTDHDQLLPLAVEYLPYLGTSDMTAEELRKELFKLGLSFDVFSSRDRSYIVLSGLNESLEPGVELFEKVLANVEPNEEALSNMIDGMLKERQDAMKSKGQILFNAMSQYAQYGTDNPLKNILSEEELRSIQPEELISRLKEITSYEHMIYYYGPQDYKEAMATIDKYHKVPAEMKAYPEPKVFKELPIEDNKVYFVDYDMVQSELLMSAKGPQFDAELAPEVNLFNQYFGSGLSSIVFQEIRESKALAYSAYSFFTMPADKDDSHYVRAYIGAQVDKLPEATNAMITLMNDMPRADIQFEAARDAAMKQIETNRTTRSSMFWSYLSAQKRGLDYDMNEKVYGDLQNMSFEDLQAFFDTNVKGKPYTFSVIGNKELVDQAVLEELGTLEELTLEELFGYPEEKDMMVKN